MEFALEIPCIPALTVNTAHDTLDGSERIKQRRHTVHGGNDDTLGVRLRKQSVTGRHQGEIGITGGHRGSPGLYTLAEMLELQGLPPDFLDHVPFTMQGKRKAIGNGVPQAMGRALARAIRLAMCLDIGDLT
jgi:site-specific DNA-cytosine methylase